MNTKTYDLGLLFLRLSVGCLMLTHGIPKFQTLLAGGEIQFPDPIGLGATFSLAMTVFAEAICSFLIIIGLKTRLASIPLVITMFVAAFIVHGNDAWAVKEKAVLYLCMYIVLLFTGAGNHSVDSKLK
jgi:putative oxidoreductase